MILLKKIFKSERAKLGSEEETRKFYFRASTERTKFASVASQLGNEGMQERSYCVAERTPPLRRAGKLADGVGPKIIILGLIVLFSFSMFLIGVKTAKAQDLSAVSTAYSEWIVPGAQTIWEMARHPGEAFQTATGVPLSTSGIIILGIKTLGSIFAGIIGAVIMLLVYLIIWIIYLNGTLINSSVINTGFNVTVSLANLGFITLIIIIALATILRSQTYGIKQLFTKLVIAALLINFSLVMAGAIINVSDQLTLFFLNNIASGGVTGFASKVGSAFQPQQIMGYAGEIAKGTIQQQQGPPAPTLDDGTLAYLVSLGFAIIFPLLMALSLFALFVMLMIRYVYLGILLILMPLAWVTWISPMTKNLWEKWWKEFIRWTFFSPIMMMFLYIAMASVDGLHKQGGRTMTSITNTSVGAGLGQFLKVAARNTLANLLTSIGDQIILCGLVVGGLFAANSMGIVGASTFYNAAKSVGTGVGNYLGAQGKRWGTAPFRSSWGQRGIGWMQRGPLGVSFLGRQLASVAEKGGKDLVATEAKSAEKLSTERLVTESQGYMPDYKKLAYAQELVKRDDFRPNSLPIGTLLSFLGNQKMFTNFGQQGTFKSFQKKSGMTAEMIEVGQELEAAKKRGAPAAEIQAVEDKLQRVTDAHFGKEKSENISQMSPAMLQHCDGSQYGGASLDFAEAIQKAQISSIARTSPESVVKMATGLPPTDFKNVIAQSLEAAVSKIKVTPTVNVKNALDAYRRGDTSNTDFKQLASDLKTQNARFYNALTKGATGRMTGFGALVAPPSAPKARPPRPPSGGGGTPTTPGQFTYKTTG